MNPNDVSILSAAPVEITIDGAAYKVGPLKIRELGLLQAWVKTQVPHPIEAIKPHLTGLPEVVQIAMAESARQEAKSWPPQVGSIEANRLFSGADGEKELLFVILSKYQPHLTRADTDAMADRLSLAEFKAIADVAFGKGPDLPKPEGPDAGQSPGQ